jgi:hypothetical protein
MIIARLSSNVQPNHRVRAARYVVDASRSTHGLIEPGINDEKIILIEFAGSAPRGMYSAANKFGPAGLNKHLWGEVEISRKHPWAMEPLDDPGNGIQKGMSPLGQAFTVIQIS